MIDEHGYRANVGIVLMNKDNQVLWAKRHNAKDAWQFPQGGLKEGESLEDALYRELEEELGLAMADVTLIQQTQHWVAYDLPKRFRRYHQKPLCVGQKQKWFLLQLDSPDSAICLDRHPQPEFDEWKWVDFWYPLDHVIEFKRDVYEKVLTELEQNLRV